MEIFCFLIGILYTYTHHYFLPIAMALIFFITPRSPIMIFFCLGMFLAWIHQWWLVPQGLPEVSVIQHAMVQGRIDSIPIQTPNKTQFVLNLDHFNGKPAQGLVQLAWYTHAQTMHAGERWQFSVKLKKPRDFHNPGSYNYERSLATRHILWTGYIQNKNNILLNKNSSGFSWLKAREHLANLLKNIAPDEQSAGILQALTLNITTHISQDEWNLFRRTGTIHLFGISGEHIALISGLIFGLSQWLWSRSATLCLRIPAIYVGSICGLIAALLYSFLAGFAPPVQRALIGCIFYTLYCLGKKRLTPWQVWRYAMLGVLLLEPHAVFMQGFYFSFLAVACLLLTQQRWGLKGLYGNLALQLSCLIGLMPLSLYWFSYGSINGFIANLFAIPLVGFLIVPLSLLILLVHPFKCSWVLMKALSILIALLFQGLNLTERIAAMNIDYYFGSIQLVLVLLGALLLWVLLPIKPFRWIALLWLILPFFPTRTTIHQGEALIHVLDVGQGLAVSIQTQNHVLLYDTGDQFFQGSDLGTMVILPFYKSNRTKKIDRIIISHPDKDHLGGLKSVEKELPGAQLLVNNPRYYHRGLNCHGAPDWIWDKVLFHFIPITKDLGGKNNNSCILKISTKAGSILLTGDIEQIAEDYLIKTYGSALQSEVLIVPHHGSKTSSSYRFILEVAPRYAIASLGFDNRFHFPHAKTVANFKALNIPFLRTDECGMTELLLPNKGMIQKPICYIT